MKSLTLKYMSPAEMTTIMMSDLADMQAEIAEVSELAKTLRANFDAVIQIKFADQIEKAYAQKHTGTSHITNGEFDIEINVPKKIDWNQSLMRNAEQQIREWGDDPEEYISITRKVSESAWKSWPTSLKEKFANARTEGTGKPQFKIERKEK